MDKEFEKKVRQKRIRAVVVAIVLLAAAIYLIAGTKVEKADYTKSLNKEIETAKELYAANKDNGGNGTGQYAVYTLLKFEKDIARAEAVAADEESEYHTKKTAYETLKAQNDTFKKDQNMPVITAEDMAELIEGKEEKTVEAKLENGEKVTYAIDGSRLRKAVDVNLMVRVEGPYYEEINAMMAKEKLQGQVISFYQDGSFGGKIRAAVPFYSKDKAKGYVYKFDVEKEKLTFVSKAVINESHQTAAFFLKEGGNYVVLTKKVHKEEKERAIKDSAGEEESQKEKTKKNSAEKTETASTALESPKASQKGTPLAEEESKAIPSNDTEKKTEDESSVKSQENATEEKKENNPTPHTTRVSLDIRCDTLAADLSKLRDPSLESYVPADGVILSLTNVEVKKGESVYDVLDRICRDKGIHLEAVYTPNYGADYIEGINYLYEFDAGEQSGWMYTVNGIFPNYGCSDYIPENGDHIVWAYTCDMGKDLGK